MSWPAVLLTPRRRALAAFVLAELVLAMAIPFLGIAGYHALLDSRAGHFIEEPTAEDPGWRAVVDPSPVTALVERHDGETTGIVLVAGHPDGAVGGAAILVPATLQIDGVGLDTLPPADAVAALASALRLRIGSVEVLDDDRWSELLGDATYEVSNPDPVVGDDGLPLLPIGEIDLGAEHVTPFLGRPSPGSDPITLLYRRELFWAAVLASPPTGSDPVATVLGQAAGPAARVVVLPLELVVADPAPDLEAAELMIREVVPIPAGAEPGDRVQVRVIDRTGVVDLETVAALVASTGSEVVEIGNATSFDDGLTHLVVPVGIDDPVITELATLTGATTVLDSDVESDGVVTLLVGADYAAGDVGGRDTRRTGSTS